MASNPWMADPKAGGAGADISGPGGITSLLGAGGGGGANAPISGPLQRGMLPEFPQPNDQDSYLTNLLRQMQSGQGGQGGQSTPTGPSYSRW